MRLIRWTTDRNVARAVVDRIEQLANFPGLGRPGEMKGTREFIIPPYVFVYRVTEEIVEILHIWHGGKIGISLHAAPGRGPSRRGLMLEFMTGATVVPSPLGPLFTMA